MTIEVEKKDHIATITFNRPEARHAMDLPPFVWPSSPGWRTLSVRVQTSVP